ncbi:MAG: formyltetrahydrofolate deformylase [Verrucomicrobiota bacterium]
MKIYGTLTLIGRDKTGVIARVTQFLFQQQANIESLEEQVSRGEFSMTLQASWPSDVLSEKEVKLGLQSLAKELKMDLRLHFASEDGKQRMALLVTKESHVFDAIMKAVHAGKIKALPVVVISNRKDLQSRVEKAGLPFHYVKWDGRLPAEEAAMKLLDRYEVNFMVLARFMKILSPSFVWRWKNRIINIHPSLLPAFPGASAYRQAYEKGVKIVGVTSHFVTPDLDQGPILCQESLKVKSGEALASIVARGQELEGICTVKAVRLFLDERLDVHWGRVWNI